jgi:hypothetical protein
MTARIHLAHGQIVRVFCVDPGHEGLLDLHKLIARELGDLPLQDLRYRFKATRLVAAGPGIYVRWHAGAFHHPAALGAPAEVERTRL